MFFKHLSLPILTTLVLVACGGGGGSSSSVPPASAAAPFSPANYSTIATPAASSLISVASSGNIVGALSADSSNGGFALLRGDSVGIARWALARMNTPVRENPKAVQSIDNVPCGFSGTLSGSANDRDNNGDLSAGDSLSIAASNCRFVSGDLPLNGNFSMTVNAVTFNAFGEVRTASLGVTFTNFGAAGNILNGAVSMQLDTTNDSYSASYSNFTSTRGSGTPTVANLTVSAVGSQVTIAGTITVNNNTYTLSTPIPLSFGLTYPIAGTFRLTDAAGGRIDFVSSASNVVFELYLPGDSVRDAQITTTWASLDNT